MWDDFPRWKRRNGTCLRQTKGTKIGHQQRVGMGRTCKFSHRSEEGILWFAEDGSDVFLPWFEIGGSRWAALSSSRWQTFQSFAKLPWHSSSESWIGCRISSHSARHGFWCTQWFLRVRSTLDYDEVPAEALFGLNGLGWDIARVENALDALRVKSMHLEQ